MQEILTSDDFGANATGTWAVLAVALTGIIGYAGWSAIRAGDYRLLAVLGVIWLVGASQIAAQVLGVRRVTVDADSLRFFSLGEVRVIPLTRIRGVELDFPRSGAPRRILVTIEPEPGAKRELEWLELIPRGGEFGFGGREVADDLRRRVLAARAGASKS